MIWEGVSSAISQIRQVGLGYLIGFRSVLCLLRKQWPVSHLAAKPNESLSSLSRELDFLGAVVGKNILVCLYSVEVCHFLFHFLSIAVLIMFLMYGFGNGV